MKGRKQKGFSLIELLIVVAIILVIAAIAIPSLIKSRQTSNESAAVGSLKTMNTALFRYTQQCPTGYPAALTSLGPGAGDCTASQDLDSTLGVATPAKSGFNFTYTPGAANAAGIVDSFTINADPWSATSARKHFYMAQDGVVHWNATAPASATDPAI